MDCDYPLTWRDFGQIRGEGGGGETKRRGGGGGGRRSGETVNTPPVPLYNSHTASLA